MATSNRELIKIKDEYREAHAGAYASLRVMLRWAIAQGKFELDMSKAFARALNDFGRALASERVPDGRGREIRVNLPFRDPAQGWLWDERDTISRAHMELNVQHNRRLAYGDIRSTMLSIQDYNKHHADEPPIQFSLNFSADLADDGIQIDAPTDLTELLGAGGASTHSSGADSRRTRDLQLPSSRPQGDNDVARVYGKETARS
jgi:hypothetical protein